MDEMKIAVVYRCPNSQCSIFQKPMKHLTTRSELRESCQPRGAKMFQCFGCGKLFELTDHEKATTLRMLDEEAAVEAGR